MGNEWDYSLKELEAIKTMVKELHHWYGYDIDNFKISASSVILWDENVVVEIDDKYNEYSTITKIRPMSELDEWHAEEQSKDHYIYTETSDFLDDGNQWHKQLLDLIDKVWNHIIDKYIEYTSQDKK